MAEPTGGRKPWTVEDLKALLAGTADPAQVAQRDRKGFTAPVYATMEAARAADALLPLLSLLDPPEGPSKMDQLLELLERLVAAQEQLAQRMGAIESRLAGHRPPSPAPTRPHASPR